jgi:hypothetical protein
MLENIAARAQRVANGAGWSWQKDLSERKNQHMKAFSDLSIFLPSIFLLIKKLSQ